MSRITIVSVPEGDWEGLYVDGVLKYQSHEISMYHLVNRREIFPIQEIKEFYFEGFDVDKGLPKNLKDVFATRKDIVILEQGEWFKLIL